MEHTSQTAKPSFSSMLRLVTETDQDFEWYPTTDEIIHTIKEDLREKENDRYDRYKSDASILDCGAGDGRVLKALTDGKKYAIEKSKPLLESLDSDIFVVGTDFHSQTLIDKRVDVVFSNPPYSVFEEWAAKIINEANAGLIYLVLPARWKDSKVIALALENRDAEAESLGTYDFFDAERSARAVVNVIRISLTWRSRYNSNQKVDPFNLWFDQHFKIQAPASDQSKHGIEKSIRKDVSDTIESSQEIIRNKGLIQSLEDFYQRDLNKLMANYKSVAALDPDLLYELGVNVNGIRESLALKITSLKDVYWRELINNLSTVTNKLATSSRDVLIGTLLKNTHVDYNSDNAHAIVLWLIKNANSYFDSQLIELVKTMTKKANVLLYKSNQKTYRDEQWRYNSRPDNLEKYMLDYRIVLERLGGISQSYSGGFKLSEAGGNLLNDICTIAYNIGFDSYNNTPAQARDWSPGVAHQFTFRDRNGRDEILFDVRAFKNGNLHIKLNQNFICRLNVEFGRLQGWLKSARQAAEELDIPLCDAEQGFGANFKLEATSSLPLRLFSAA